ncbi:MAG: 4Fe-4S binding protein [Symbiobacteriaceae bacterium]|nr:4Fe-4S binding protein [Symbiobacteriaceae bacterium]
MTLTYLKDVVTLSFSPSKCIGCGLCTMVCPHGVFAMKEKEVQIVNRDACMECGACALNCPAKAIEVDAGVGCAAAIITGWITGGEPSCDCAGPQKKSRCC